MRHSIFEEDFLFVVAKDILLVMDKIFRHVYCSGVLTIDVEWLVIVSLF